MPDITGAFNFEGWALLVHIAALSQVIGYLIRDQLWLRVMLFVGTLFYIAYYWLYPEIPLWDAIFWSTALALANLLIMVAICRDRMRFSMTKEEAHLFANFAGLMPGEFRRLMRSGEIHEVTEEDVLTHEGEVPDALYFVIEGRARVAKGERAFWAPEGVFIGELAFLSTKPASATVTLSDGARYVRWDRTRLRVLMERRPSMKLAIERMLSHDMAEKIRRS